MKHLELIDLHARAYTVHDAEDNELSSFTGRIYPANEPRPAEPRTTPLPPRPAAGPTPTPAPIEWPKINTGGGISPRLRAPKPVEREFAAWDELASHVKTLQGPNHVTLRLHAELPDEAEQRRLVHSLPRDLDITVVTSGHRA